MQVSKGALYLIPVPITEEGINTIPQATREAVAPIQIFIAERGKTARMWLRQIVPGIDMQALQVLELDKHKPQEGLNGFLQQALGGKNIGLMSEAGCPGVADPGAEVVRLAHQLGITVIPLVGPSSILLALMSSGLTGQKFFFHGYLPAQKQDLRQVLKQLEGKAIREKCTQIFIETPYRNNQVFEAAMEVLSSDVRLVIAKDLSGPEQWIGSKAVKDWKKMTAPELYKTPAVFLIGAN